jgi:hypothetical protein
MELIFHENYSINFRITEDEKKQLLKEFSDKFNSAHKLMVWIEDPNVPVRDRTEYFPNMFFIFQSMDRLLKMLLDAGLSETDIVKALNDLPF